MQFTIKLFPEITIKSRPVRNRMVSQLRNNLFNLLQPLDEGVVVQKKWDRVLVETATDEENTIARMVSVLKCTPGISNFLQVVEYPWLGMEDAFEKTRALWGERLKGKTFALRCKRTGKHDFKSTDVEYEIGGRLKAQCETAGVNLGNPDVMVRLELRDDQFSVVLNRFEGLGGYPLGTQDSVLSLISGGFDSPVASYLTIKRGLLTHYCFFNLGGRAHEVGVKEVAVYLWMKYGASHKVKFVTVPFEDLIKEILEQVDNSQMGVVLKRMMLRAATRMAEQLNIPALVTGESVAQVSSQTLQNLTVIDRVTDTLVLRPLITADKTDIIKVARQIGTEKFAEAMPEYCGVISIKPTTRAKLERIEKEESHFDNSVLEAAIAQARVVNINDIVADVEKSESVDNVEVPDEADSIIDIRHPEEEERSALVMNNNAVIKIPFYNLHVQFQALDPDKTWLLYCEKGVMSQLHAQYLKDEGFSNIKVYRPPKNRTKF